MALIKDDADKKSDELGQKMIFLISVHQCKSVVKSPQTVSADPWNPCLSGRGLVVFGLMEHER
jgi:hypothetical protein